MKGKTLSAASILFVIFIVITSCVSSPPSSDENNENAVTKVAEAVQKAWEIQGDLYIMAVGINEYSSNVFSNLKYAANDAKTICDLFGAQAGKIFGSVKTLLIADKESITPTKENILSNLDFFKDAGEKDTAIIFIASHRIIIDNTFYIMSSDSQHNSDEGFILSSFININDILNKLDFNGNKILIIDTSAPEIAKDGNFTVIRACKENEQAIESSTYNGGLLTASIQDAFEKIETEYGLITIGALFDYAVKRVGEMSDRKQTPVLNAASNAKDIVIGLVIGSRLDFLNN